MVELAPSIPADPRLALLHEACDEICDTDRTQVIDPYYRVAAEAIKLETMPGGHLTAPVLEAFEAHENIGYPITPYTMVHLLCRSLHFYALQREIPGYPHEYGPDAGNATAAWRELAGTAASDPSRELQQVINHRTINSTVPERARGMEIVASLFPERFRGAHGLDIGANFGFLHQCLVDPRLRTALGLNLVDDHGVTSHRLTGHLLRQLGAPEHLQPLIGTSLGIDIVDCRHPVNTAWALHCSVTPGELMRDRYRYETLEQEHVRAVEHSPNVQQLVQLEWGDIFTQHAEGSAAHRFLRSLGRAAIGQPRRFDFTTALTVGYLFDEEKRRELIDQMMHLTQPDGLLFVQDTCRAVPPTADRPEPYNLAFEPNIYRKPWLYRLLVYDKLQPEEGWQELMTYRTPRCLEARLGDGRLRVGKEALSIFDRMSM